jgi:PilZ domain
MSDERRRLDRKFLTFFARVTDRRNGKLVGYLVDLTTKGALLVGDTPVEINTVLSLRVDLPEGFPLGEKIDLDVRAVWSRPDTDPDLYRTGLELIHSSPEIDSVLKRILTEYGWPEQG